MTAVATPDPDDEDDEVARKREELLARRTKVMFLRNAGATWSTIAAETGVSEATARKDYAVVCRDINAEQPANVVARHRAVIFDIQRANYPAMMQGDKDAAATILKALDREAKLLGLDAPTKLLASVSGEEFANEAARLIARITELDPTTMKELTRVRQQEVIEGTVVDPVADPAVDGAPGQPADLDAAGGAPPGDDAAPPARDADTDDGDAAQRHEAGHSRGAGRPAFDPLDATGWSNIGDDDDD